MKITPDSISETDELNRRPFAKEIALNIISYLESNAESLTIGIHGPWGSGKSTLLGLVKKEIRKGIIESTINSSERKFQWSKFKSYAYNKFHLLEFNPWMFSGKSELQSAFLNELAIKIEKRKFKRALKSLSNKLEWVDDMHKIVSVIRRIFAAWSNTSVESIKDQTNEILVKEGIKILVIMDDIDRLSPPEILEIFQLIKLNANFKNTVFLISFDKGVVKESISNQYNFDGEKYLEKIIQVDYSLPATLPEDIEYFFFSRLNELLAFYKIEFDIKRIHTAWYVKGLKHYFKNVRDLNRYFNGLKFRIPSFHKNVDLRDFLVMESIRLFDFEVYEIIKNNYKEFKQLGPDTLFKEALDSITQSRAGMLFNYICQKGETKDKSQVSYSIADPLYFDRYFSLSVSKRDLLEEEFERFLKFPDLRMQFLNNIISNDKTQFLLRRMSTKELLINIVDKQNLIICLLRVWDKHLDEFAIYWREVWKVLRSIVELYEDEKVGFDILVDEINTSGLEFNPVKLIFPWLLLENIDRANDKNIDPDLKVNYDLLKSKRQSIESTLKSFLQNYQTHFLHGNTSNQIYVRIFILCLAKYHSEVYTGLAKELIRDQKRIFLILNMFLNRDSETKVPFAFNPEYLPLLLPGELRKEFDDSLKSINSKTLAIEDAKAVEAYLAFARNNP